MCLVFLQGGPYLLGRFSSLKDWTSGLKDMGQPVHYYPAANLAHCASRLSFQHVLLALGINVWPLTPNNRHLGLRIRDPWQFQNLTFSDYLKVAASKDTAVNLKLQEASLHHSHKADCYDYGRRRIYAVIAFLKSFQIH